MRPTKWKRRWTCPRCKRRFRLQRGEYWDTDLCPGCWKHQLSRSRKRGSPERMARILRRLGYDPETALQIARRATEAPRQARQ